MPTYNLYFRGRFSLLLMLAAFSLLSGGCKHIATRPSRDRSESMFRDLSESPGEQEFKKL